MFHRFVSLGGRLRRSAYTFVFALVAGALIIAISEGAYHESAAQLDVLAERGRVRVSLLNLVRRITDAESGQRGYMLTGRPEYLAPYEFARRDAMAALESLRRSYATLGTPGAEQERAALAEALAMKLSEIDEVLKLYEQGRVQAAIDLLQSGIGRDQMERIRSLADAMLNDENARMSTALGNVYGTLQLSRIGVASMTIVSLFALAMFLQQRRLLDRHRLEQQALMQAERDRLEEEVQRRTRELTELARHLQTAREDERARLARELHDELGALLTAAKLDVARIRPKLQPALPDLMPRLTHLTKTLDSGIALKRRIIEDLRPSSLSNLGLKPALEILCVEFGERLGVPVDIELEPLKLSPAAELTVFRIVQESLTNIGKYARATQIRVSLEREGDRARVRVADDGVGFDPDQVKPATHGLLGMRYRVESEGGELRISSAPGSGTVLSAWLPIEPSLQPTAAAA